MINLLLFANFQEVIGSKALSLELNVNNILELKNYLLSKYPELDFNFVMVAVNEEYATDETVIKSGDVVAFIPPVSGG
ncbi:MAG: moaD [Bacillales bacterium]|jgi:molybdopterin synthase sulfur carrier subunit|nr:moaD [Bacillales bacterium]